MEKAATGSGIGQPVRRREDLRLVRGAGRYTADENLPDQAYAVMLRSPHAHARIRAVATDKAHAVPGVLAVLTGADALADGLKPIPHKPWSPAAGEIKLRNSDGSDIFSRQHHLLPADKAHFAGEVVAIVVAETVECREGRRRGDRDRLRRVARRGRDRRRSAAGCADRPRRATHAQTSASMPKSATPRRPRRLRPRRACRRGSRPGSRASPACRWSRAPRLGLRSATGRYTVYAGNGGAVRLKNDLAAILGVPSEHVRVLMGDVGGNFGTRGMIYAEFALVAWAARKLGRPVKWIIERHEALLGDYQARDLVSEAELALDAKGRFLAIRGSNLGNLGAHTTNFPMVQKGVQIMSSIYRMPAAHFRARAVLSNTAPTRPYRSAGRPEVIYIMERLIDLAAREHGFDRVTLRRRNLIPEQELPYLNPFGLEYDNGDYIGVMDPGARARRLEGFQEAPRRGEESAADIAASGSPITSTPRPARRTRRPRSRCCRKAWSISWSACRRRARATRPASRSSSTNGSACRSRRCASSPAIPTGSRSAAAPMPAAACGWRASSSKSRADMVIAKALRIAEHLLETAAADIEFKNGRFTVKGTNHGIGLFEAARAAAENTVLPDELRGPLAAAYDEIITAPSFPYGAHVCEVEVDPETGVARVVNYVAVDDVGRAVNPLVVHGQVHGGIAQGFGQAMMENVHYNPRADKCWRPRSWITPCRAPTDLPLLQHRAQRSSGDLPPARHPSGRRRRHGAGARRHHQRHRRCAVGVRRHATSKCRRRRTKFGKRYGMRGTPVEPIAPRHRPSEAARSACGDPAKYKGKPPHGNALDYTAHLPLDPGAAGGSDGLDSDPEPAHQVVAGSRGPDRFLEGYGARGAIAYRQNRRH